MMDAGAAGRRSVRVARLLFGGSVTGRTLDLALLAGRIVLAWIFVYYGSAKLFGAFPGPGPHGLHQTAQFMAQVAHLRPGGLFALVAAVLEFGGGIAVGIGLATRFAGLALFADMVLAMATVTWGTGINSDTSPPGYQLNLALAAPALVSALVGGGAYSVDALITRRLQRADAGATAAPSGQDPASRSRR